MAQANSYKGSAPTITTAVAILAENRNRKVIMLYNQDATNAVRVYFGAANSAAYIEVPAKQGLNLTIPCIEEVWAVAIAGAPVLTVYEG